MLPPASKRLSSSRPSDESVRQSCSHGIFFLPFNCSSYTCAETVHPACSVLHLACYSKGSGAMNPGTDVLALPGLTNLTQLTLELSQRNTDIERPLPQKCDLGLRKSLPTSPHLKSHSATTQFCAGAGPCLNPPAAPHFDARRPARHKHCEL